MERRTDLDTVELSFGPGGIGHRFFLIFAGLGTLFFGLGVAFGIATLNGGMGSTGALSDFFLPGIFMFIGGVHGSIGWTGVLANLRSVTARVELHRLDVEVRYAGILRQQFSVPFAELDSVELTDKALVIRGPDIEHVVTTRNLDPEGIEELKGLVEGLILQRNDAERRASAELLSVLRRTATTH